MWRRGRAGTAFGSPNRALAAASLALANRTSAALRLGLTPASARATASAVRELLGADGVSVTALDDVLAIDVPQDGQSGIDPSAAVRRIASVLGDVDVAVVPEDAEVPGAGQVVVTALVVDQRAIGTLQFHVVEADLVTVQACQETARWISGLLEFAEIDRARDNARAAELRALRAQINPHFLFNSLTTMASFVRTDPERARELLVQFAEFARYSFATDAQFTTLADELRAIDTLVSIERARFGDRFEVSIRIAPEVLATPVPFLTLQPLVENAVHHGLGNLQRPGLLTIVASDRGNEAHVSIEDNGVGADPDRIARVLAGQSTGDREHVGLANVDERLRMLYGSAYGLVVETAVDAGMRVSLRFPKSRQALGPTA